MGEIYKLACKNCGYQRQLFEGGGELASKRTMICTNCAEVVAVLTWLAADAPPEWIKPANQKMERCPECEGTNLKEWPESHPCPKCGQAIDLWFIGNWD